MIYHKYTWLPIYSLLHQQKHINISFPHNTLALQKIDQVFPEKKISNRKKTKKKKSNLPLQNRDFPLFHPLRWFEKEIEILPIVVVGKYWGNVVPLWKKGGSKVNMWLVRKEKKPTKHRITFLVVQLCMNYFNNKLLSQNYDACLQKTVKGDIFSNKLFSHISGFGRSSGIFHCGCTMKYCYVIIWYVFWNTKGSSLLFFS